MHETIFNPYRDGSSNLLRGLIEEEDGHALLGGWAEIVHTRMWGGFVLVAYPGRPVVSLVYHCMHIDDSDKILRKGKEGHNFSD